MNWLILALAILGVALSGFNAFSEIELRELRAEFQQRQTYINEGVQYRNLNEQFIKALATAAANTGDEGIRDMLSSEGVTYTVNPPEEAVEPAEKEGAEP